MNVLLIYKSYHHGNTEKIARAMAEAPGVTAVDVSQARALELSDYDLIGFGSGLYMGGFHADIDAFIDAADLEGKRTFLVLTSGSGLKRPEKTVRQLEAKGAELVGHFSCKGYDTFGPFKLVGGIAKGHPNDKDIADAKAFIQKLLQA